MPDVIPTLRYDDAPKALRFLQDAFGLEEVVVYSASGAIAHAQLRWGDSLVMLRSRSAHELDEVAGLAWLHVVVEDPDEHHAKAVLHGAEVVQPLETAPHGRSYTARDTEGNLWTFGTYRPGPP